MAKVEEKPRSTLDEAVLFAVTEAQLLVLQDEPVDRGARELLRWLRRRKVLELAVQRVSQDAALVPEEVTRQKVTELLEYALATGLLY
ncbi:MAG: hypothetical protein M3N98_10520 [Actinomycetota bacterium]|nr:hypothetical protein [Actinomycetota bacterium]